MKTIRGGGGKKDEGNEGKIQPHIKIAVRVRPEHKDERSDKRHRIVVKTIDDKMLLFDPEEEGIAPSTIPDNYNKPKDKRFAFDVVLDQYATQRQVYEATTQQLIDPVLNGYNATVFAYGATGSGKTHTMIGSQSAGPGVMVLSMRDLFEAVHGTKQDANGNLVEFKIEMSYLEIYNETIRDLLIDSDRPLDIRENSKGDCVIHGLTKHTPPSSDEVFKLLEVGNARRSMSPTDQNAQSSRSHAVLQIWVTQTKVVKFRKQTRLGKLSLVDLAGSERAAATTNRAQRLVEGANINRSLLALANCINALASAPSAKKKFVPYRDSKLTRLLKDSLGGNCITVMIANISPSSLTYEDTHNTLKYADRAKQIKCETRQNVRDVKSHITEYRNIISQLEAEIESLRSKLADQNQGGISFREGSGRDFVASSRLAFEKLNKEITERGTSLISGLQALLHTRHQQCHQALDYARKVFRVQIFQYQREAQTARTGTTTMGSPPIPMGRIRMKQQERDNSFSSLNRLSSQWHSQSREAGVLEDNLFRLQSRISEVELEEHQNLLQQSFTLHRFQMERLTNLIRFERQQCELELRALYQSSYSELLQWELSRTFQATSSRSSGESQMIGIELALKEQQHTIDATSLLDTPPFTGHSHNTPPTYRFDNFSTTQIGEEELSLSRPAVTALSPPTSKRSTGFSSLEGPRSPLILSRNRGSGEPRTPTSGKKRKAREEVLDQSPSKSARKQAPDATSTTKPLETYTVASLFLSSRKKKTNTPKAQQGTPKTTPSRLVHRSSAIPASPFSTPLRASSRTPSSTKTPNRKVPGFTPKSRFNPETNPSTPISSKQSGSVETPRSARGSRAMNTRRVFQTADEQPRPSRRATMGGKSSVNENQNTENSLTSRLSSLHMTPTKSHHHSSRLVPPKTFTKSKATKKN